MDKVSKNTNDIYSCFDSLVVPICCHITHGSQGTGAGTVSVMAILGAAVLVHSSKVHGIISPHPISQD
jgi:hypothetical protein